jgi:hypothetical protein
MMMLHMHLLVLYGPTEKRKCCCFFSTNSKTFTTVCRTNDLMVHSVQQETTNDQNKSHRNKISMRTRIVRVGWLVGWLLLLQLLVTAVCGFIYQFIQQVTHNRLNY